MSSTIWFVTESSNVSEPSELTVMLFVLAFAVASTTINFKFVDWVNVEIAGKLIVTGPNVVSHSNLTSWNCIKPQEGSATKLYVPVIILNYFCL